MCAQPVAIANTCNPYGYEKEVLVTRRLSSSLEWSDFDHTT